MTTTTITWTRVADQLPDDDTTVLIACFDGDVVSGWHEDGQWRDASAWTLPDDYVTHWAEMPAPPEMPR